MPTRLNWGELYQLTGAGLFPQPMIRRARPSVSLLCVYGGQLGVVLDQRDHCGPDEAGAHATTAGHWGKAGAAA